MLRATKRQKTTGKEKEVDEAIGSGSTGGDDESDKDYEPPRKTASRSGKVAGWF